MLLVKRVGAWAAAIASVGVLFAGVERGCIRASPFETREQAAKDRDGIAANRSRLDSIEPKVDDLHQAITSISAKIDTVDRKIDHILEMWLTDARERGTVMVRRHGHNADKAK